MASHSFVWLLWFFFTCSLAYSLLAGSILYLSNAALFQGFLKSMLYVFGQLYETDLFTLDFSALNILGQAIFLMNKIVAVLAPGLVFGTIVFKLFYNPDILTFKRKMNLFLEKGQTEKLIAIRFYSSSRLNLTNVHMKVVLRIQRIHEDTGSKVVYNRPLKCHDTWDFGTPSVPLTIDIILQKGDIDETTGKLKSIQGNELSEKNDIWLIVSGEIPQLGTSFTERKIYSLENDLDEFEYGGVEVDYETDPTTWKGWKTFDS